MRTWLTIIALVAGLSLAGVAQAKGAGKGAGKPVVGTIQSVAADGSSLSLAAGKKAGGQVTTVTLDAGTSIKIDGAPGKTAADLKAGMKARVRESAGKAVSIEATSGGKQGKKAK